MSIISIKPCDSMFFGDGNQFNFGINNIIRSKNTPFSSTFFGAIFTALLTKNDCFRKSFFSQANYDHEKILNIEQIYIYNIKDNKVYIKAPMDLFMTSKEILFGSFKQLNGNVSSLHYNYILESPKNNEYEKVNNKYIDINNVYDSYLKKQGIRINLIDEKELFAKRFKVGIGIDKLSKTVQHGKLYKIEQTEFVDDTNNMDNEWAYLVDYSICEDYVEDKYNGIELNDLDYGHLKLGGENKACKYKKEDNGYIKRFKIMSRQKPNNNIFKVVFTSSAYFEEGINKVFQENNMKILGIANDKPIYIGGYDMKTKSEKNGAIRKMYKGYPAGTVVLVEKIDKSRDILECNNPKGFNKYVVLEEK
ncbi:hypothetical protein AN1V17_17110 [Vallitalea sediminicola]